MAQTWHSVSVIGQIKDWNLLYLQLLHLYSIYLVNCLVCMHAPLTTSKRLNQISSIFYVTPWYLDLIICQLKTKKRRKECTKCTNKIFKFAKYLKHNLPVRVNLKKVAKNREILVILYNAICSISIIVACYLSSINLVPSASQP